jgi:hypothetical protein
MSPISFGMSWACPMDDAVLLDNDIVFKACCFAVVQELADFFVGRKQTLWILGVAAFVLRRRIARFRNLANPQRIAEAFEKTLETIARLEPDDREVALASEFEACAQSMGLALDTGESLLLAILLNRSADLLVTGDKRAIEAIDQIATALRHHEAIDGRLVCLEQVVLTLAERLGLGVLRSRICAEPHADRALAICFSCNTGLADDASTGDGVRSYINALRQRSGAILLSGDTISAVVA